MTLPDVDSISTYGGALQDYSPVVDPTTDESAAFRNKYAANVAMATHTNVRAMRSFVGVEDDEPEDPVVGLVHDAVWGAAPSLKPTVVRDAEGVWTVTWPATVNDELAAQHTVNLRRALAQVECTSTLRHATARVVAANEVEVRGFLADGTPDDLDGHLVTVWVW
jgi:hypothetical protein